VKTQTLRVLATAAGFALLIAGAASARPAGSTAAAIRVSTTMTAAEEVPTPTGQVTGARGTFSATVTRTASGAQAAWRERSRAPAAA
jgi:hypothetical protein